MGKLLDEGQGDLRFANSLLSVLIDSSPVNPKTVDFLAFMEVLSLGSTVFTPKSLFLHLN